MRRASLLSALVMTALMMLMLPGLWRELPGGDGNRMHESLRPARLRTLTVWLLDGEMGDGRLLRECISDFEREREGVRVFLRAGTAAELAAPDAVKPDVVLHATGSLCGAESALLPLAAVEGVDERALAAGQSGGRQLAAALWLAPNVLGVPRAWLASGEEAEERSSLLATRQPEAARQEPLTAGELPWRGMVEAGGIALPQGVALQQILWMCPVELRTELARMGSGQDGSATAQTQRDAPEGHPTAASARAAWGDSTPTPWSTSVPVSRGMARPTAAPAPPARVYTLAGYRAAAKDGSLVPLVLQPATSDRVRWVSLCRDGEDARAFVRYLCREERCEQALAHGLLCAAHPGGGEPKDACAAELCERFRAGMTLPNAFSHTRQELYALCADAFRRAADPVETLLRLR